MTRKNGLWFALAIMLGAGFCVFLSFKDFIYLTADQRSILSALRAEFASGDGVAKLDMVLRSEDWDEICIVPAYAYVVFGDKEKLRANMHAYFGADYRFNWLTTPDTSAMTYGLGFSFLKQSRLKKFVKVPPATLVFFREGLVSREPSDVRVSETNILILSDLNVTFKDEPKKCYPRSTAYLKYKGYQHIELGG